MNLEQLIQPVIRHHIRFFIEASKCASFLGNVDADASIDGKSEQNHKPDWTIKDGDTKYVPVHGDPTP